MKPSKPWSTAATLAVAALLLIASKPSYGDTYQIFDLGSENGHNLYGIDSSGAVVTLDPYGSSPPYFVYRTWVNGVVVDTSFTPPTLDYDDGVSCTPTVSTGVAPGPGNGRCNNGHEVYLGLYAKGTPPLDSYGIFTGPNLSDLLTSHGTLDSPMINSSGDIAWVDGLDEEFYMAIDLTTRAVPEPGTLVLLGTGALASIGALRRRLWHSPK